MPTRRITFLLFWACVSGCGRSPSPDAGLTTQQPKPERGLIGAYYYSWYDKARWTEQPVADMPKLGHYSSGDSAVAAQHVEWAKQADIDFFVVSWLSPNGREDRNLKRTLLPELEKSNFHFALLYETRLAFGWPYDKPVDFARRLANAATAGDTMVEHFEYLAKTYFPRQSYLRMAGKPVVVFYALRGISNAVPYFKLARARLAKLGFEPYLIADLLYWEPLEGNDWALLREHFQAITAYNMYYRPNFLSAVEERFRAAKLIASSNGLIFIPNVMPGYDDRKLRGGSREALDRQAGQFYRNHWNMSSQFVGDRQPFMFITSFNEWHEGSELEPGTESGHRYLALTKELTATIRSRISGSK